MEPTLPDDLLHMLCADIAEQADFDTLFQCALAGKRLALPALTHMYKSCHQSPVVDGGNEALAMSQRQLMIQKWSILWRSVVASALGETVFPYCRYIRVLNLRDLKYLLEEDRFRDNVARQFFAGAMSQFHLVQDTPVKTGKGRARAARLKVVNIIDAIGDVLTKAAIMLEEVNGEIMPSALIRWAPRLEQLKTLMLWDGAALGDQLAQSMIHQHCRHFQELSLYHSTDPESDHNLSTFLSGMQANSLRLFEVISTASIGAETFLACNHHGHSLKDLRLCLKTDALPHLALLKGCTALESLQLTHSEGGVDLEKTQHDVFTEVIAWLRECSSLRSLSMNNFQSAAAIATRILIEDNIKLHRLEIDSYNVTEHSQFHQALTRQPNLRSLSLSGESGDLTGDDLDTLVDSLIQLKEVRELNLRGVAEFFNDQRIISIARNLPKVEDIYINGYGITDKIWPSMSQLKNLRALGIAAVSTFTIDGLLDYINSLGPGNQGIQIAVLNGNPERPLTEEELVLVKETLAQKANGSFDYTLLRDPDVSEFEGESD